VLAGEAAFEPAESVVDQRCALRALVRWDSVPVREGRHAAGEMLGDCLLVSRQQAEREPARPAQELVHGRLLTDPDSDERRLKGEGDERVDRQTQALARCVDRDDRDSRREAAKQCAKLGARLGQRRRSTSSASASEWSISLLVGSTSAS
jgi:hypothetical protein